MFRIRILALFIVITAVFFACNKQSGYKYDDIDVEVEVEATLDKTYSTIQVNGRIKNVRGVNSGLIIEHGFYYGYDYVYKEDEYDKTYTKVRSDGPIQNFSIELPADYGKKEIFNSVAYAKTRHRTFFSKIGGFIDLWDNSEMEVTISSNFSGLTYEKATLYGTCYVADEKHFPITERGFCYINTRKTPGGDPTVYDDHTVAGAGVGRFGTTITGLEPGAAYKVRAYAKNISGVVYSRSYVTLPMYLQDVFIPTLGLTDISPPVLRAEVNSDNGYIITEKGFCYNTGGTKPTIRDAKIVSGSGIGTYYLDASTLSLPPGRYFFRAYAINQAGCGYSSYTSEINIP